MGRIVKCAHCGCNMDKDSSIRYKDKNYHPECCREVKEKEKVTDYICSLFNLKKPGPRNYTLLKRYIEQEGYTYKGIFYSLKYFYEVQKHDTKKSNESIGIVPYVYEEAQKYFEELESKREKIKDAVPQVDTQKVTVKVHANQNTKKKIINLDDLLGD